jgi:L-fucose isomerase-like protein
VSLGFKNVRVDIPLPISIQHRRRPMKSPAALTLGVIIGNREFFPDQLVAEARDDVINLFADCSIRPIMVSPKDTKLGGIESHADARKCAELLKQHRDEIDGVLVVLPNFGDEKGVTDAIRIADLNVPILVQACPDDLAQLGVARRRDAFCGKVSVCNNLVQAGIKFTLTSQHVSALESPSFRSDLDTFGRVCRVVRGLCGARLGAVGARPGAFNTVRYSEKILDRNGVSVTTVDLSEFLGEAEQLSEGDPAVRAKLEEIRDYAPAPGVPAEKLVQMARLGVILGRWIEANALDATAIQCWTSVQKNFGCNVCTLMSMMSESLMPSACEVDVTGVLTMYAMQLAAGAPAAIVDWNNNYGDNEDKCALFHCGNWAKSFLPDIKIGTAPILGSTLGEENTYGALEGRTPAGPLTYGRLTTCDTDGSICAYVGEGELTDDELNTFGTRAVAHVPQLQRLMRYICNNGFEHHVVMTRSKTARALAEAFGNYLGWKIYHHGGDD